VKLAAAFTAPIIPSQPAPESSTVSTPIPSLTQLGFGTSAPHIYSTLAHLKVYPTVVQLCPPKAAGKTMASTRIDDLENNMVLVGCSLLGGWKKLWLFQLRTAVGEGRNCERSRAAMYERGWSVLAENGILLVRTGTKSVFRRDVKRK